ncbi:MAG: glycoside hydrolase family 31 protein [Verrucomicrobiota bacterium]
MPQSERQALLDGVRQILELRMRFIPYLYSAFNKYHYTGKPPVRALVLDWPDDPMVRQIDNQFMFGDSVMVAPMFAGQKSRQVYLPPGDWYDFWTHEKIKGERLHHQRHQRNKADSTVRKRRHVAYFWPNQWNTSAPIPVSRSP